MQRTGIGQGLLTAGASEMIVDPARPATGMQARLTDLVQKRVHAMVGDALASAPLQLAYFRSASFPTSMLWLHLSTRFVGNLVPDVAFVDAVFKQIGLEAPLPQACSACGSQVPNSREDHAISCAGPRGASRTAGGLVERAVLSFIRKAGVQVVPKPPLNTLPGFEPTAPDLPVTKVYGDSLVTFGGKQSVLDVTFSTCPSRRPVELKELQKINEYRRNRRRPDLVVSRFTPVAIDAAGRYGDQVARWLHDLLKRKIECDPAMRKEIRRAFRQGQESVSVAVLKAMSAYFSILSPWVPEYGIIPW